MLDFAYGLSVYGASSAPLNRVQYFCFKSKYFSEKTNLRKLLERGDKRIFRKARDQ